MLTLATSVACALVPETAIASTGKAPAIISTESGAGGKVTMGAEINPEGLATSYEIKLACNGCGPPGYAPATGQLPAVQETISVYLDVTGIQSGSYRFEVRARNAGGEAFAYGELTVPKTPAGSCPNGCGSSEQYDSEIPTWYVELSRSQSEETAKHYEAEKRIKEQEEIKAREARYAAEEAEIKSVEEREAHEAAARAHQEEEQVEAEQHPPCVVPLLRGDTLTAARHALAKANCSLGVVHRLVRHHGVAHVLRQGARPGTHLRPRARIVVWVGARNGTVRRHVVHEGH